MPVINVDDLRPGMVLAAPISGPGNRELAPAGKPLTDKQVQILRAWGIATVETAGNGPRPNEEVIIAARRTVAPRFRGQPTDHPAIRTLFAVAVVRHMQRGKA